MHYLYILLMIFFLGTNSHAQTNLKGVVHNVKLLQVIDGDTVIISAPYLPAPLKPQLSLRIYGVDTPEKGARAQCSKERIRGEMATAFTKQKISSSKQIQVLLIDWDKYGGRILGDLLLDKQSLRQMLISEGLAREYYGEAKQSWC